MAEENELIIEVTIGTPLDSTQFDISRISGLLPQGGTENQYLVKTSSVDYEAEWRDFPEITGGGTGIEVDVNRLLPQGGQDGQVLAKSSDNDYEFEYITLPEATNPVPDNRLLLSGGTANQILSKVDGTDYNVEWIDPVEPTVEIDMTRLLISGGTTGQVMVKSSDNDYEFEFADLPTPFDPSSLNIPDEIPANRLIPNLGLSGQILSKASDNPYDTEWINAPEAGTSLDGVSASWIGVSDSIINVPTPYTLVDTGYAITEDADSFNYQLILETEKGKFISPIMSGTQLNDIAVEAAGFSVVNDDGDVISTDDTAKYINIPLNSSAFSQLRGINSILLAKRGDNNNILITSTNGALENVRLIIERQSHSLIGPAGRDGSRGLDGVAGQNGRDGIDGQDGMDGMDAVFDADSLDFSNLLENERTALSNIPDNVFNITNDSTYVNSSRSFSQASGFTITLADNVEEVFGADNILHLNIAVAVGSTTYRPSLLINASQNGTALEVISGARTNLDTGENYEILIKLIDDSDITVELIAQVLSVTVRDDHTETRNVSLSAFILSEGDLYEAFERQVNSRIEALRGDLTNADSITQQTIDSFNEQLADITHITNFLTVIEGSGRVSANFLVDEVPAVNGSYTVSSAEQVSIYVPTDTQRQFVLLNGTDEVQLDYQRQVVLNDVRYSVTYPINFAAASVLTATISANTSSLRIQNEVAQLQSTFTGLLDETNAKFDTLGNLSNLGHLSNRLTVIAPTDGNYTVKDEFEEVAALAFVDDTITDSNYNILDNDVSVTIEDGGSYNALTGEATGANINVSSSDIVGLYSNQNLDKPLLITMRYSQRDDAPLGNEVGFISFNGNESLIASHVVFGWHARIGEPETTNMVNVDIDWSLLGHPNQILAVHNPVNSNLNAIFVEPNFELNSVANTTIRLRSFRSHDPNNLGASIENRTFDLTINADGTLNHQSTVFAGFTWFDGIRNQTTDVTLTFSTRQVVTNGFSTRVLEVNVSPSLQSVGDADIGLFAVNVHQQEMVSTTTPSRYRNESLPLQIGANNDMTLCLVPSYPNSEDAGARQFVDLIVGSTLDNSVRRIRLNRPLSDIITLDNALSMDINADEFLISHLGVSISKELINEIDVARIATNSIGNIFDSPVPTSEMIDFADVSDWAMSNNQEIIPSSKLPVVETAPAQARANPLERLYNRDITISSSLLLHSTGVFLNFDTIDDYVFTFTTITGNRETIVGGIPGQRLGFASIGTVASGITSDPNGKILSIPLVPSGTANTHDALLFQRTLVNDNGDFELLVATTGDTALTTELIIDRRRITAIGLTGEKGSDGAPGNDGAMGLPGNDGNDGEGVAPGGTTNQILAKVDATDFNTHWIDQPTGGGSSTPTRAPLVASEHYLHIGVPDLTATVDNSGVLGLVRMSNGTYEGTTQHAAGNNPTLFKLVFDNTTQATNVPSTWQYYDASHAEVSERGHIILPEGQFMVCASVNIRTVGFSSNAHRQVASMYITQGTDFDGNDRHGQTVYLRNSNMATAVYDDMMGVMTVSGIVIGNGVTPMFIKLAVANQSGANNPFEIHGAHCHIFQALI